MSRKMIKISTVVVAFATVSIFFQNCGVGSFSSASSISDSNSNSGNTLQTNSELDYSSFKFISSGGFAPENRAASFDDILFTWKKPVLVADSKTGDAECIKPPFTVDDSDREKIFSLIESLDIERAKDLVPIADLPTQKITILMNDGSEKTVFLGPGGANNGDLIASNGHELTKFLQDLNVRIPVACYAPKDPDELVSISFFSGGGYRPPNSPAWSHKLKFTITRQGIVVKSEVEDTLCFKPEYTLNQEDANRLLAAIQGLKKETKNDPFPIADAGTEVVTLDYSLSPDSRIHLNANSASNGELYATNGVDLAKLFKEIDEKIPMACQ